LILSYINPIIPVNPYTDIAPHAEQAEQTEHAAPHTPVGSISGDII